MVSVNIIARPRFIENIYKKIGKEPFLFAQTLEGRISYYDWWQCDFNDEWFTRFIKKNFDGKFEFNLYSVFGNGKFIRRDKRKNKIFFSGENLEKRFKKYNDYCLNCSDLSMGFAEISREDYLRFPVWIICLFSPESDEKAILNKINEINFMKTKPLRDCALIATHDTWHTRAPIYNTLKSIMEITCAGKWNNNTEELWKVYYDDKISYLKNFKFNICPENTNTENYVTEKIFEAFIAGCIPIYYGANNKPEEEVINQNAVLFWDMNSDNDALIKEIKRILSNDDYYKKFSNKPRLLPESGEYVISKFRELKRKLSEMLV